MRRLTILNARSLRWITMTLAAVTFLAVTASVHAETFKGKYPIRIGATVGMVADVVRNVGGEHVAVTQLLGAGVDPHLYKASAGDVRRMSSAQAIFYSGLHLEGKMSEVLERICLNHIQICCATNSRPI